MQPYYDDGQCVIYHGDCRDVLRTLQPRSADLLLTDPPYGVEYVTAWRSRTDNLRVPIAGDESLDLLASIGGPLDRILADHRHAYVFASSMRIGEATIALPWPVKNVLVWDKGEAGSVGDLEAGYAVNWEAVLYASKGRRTFNGPRPRAILRRAWSGTRDPVHPTVKPVDLLRDLIERSTQPGETVLDPFMGSGTTLRAAKDLGRRAIGIEVDEGYCEIGAKRLGQEVLDLGMVA
jgi:site-specific DNA-methyltransferase (adenine-specific)